jgi:hypothetical protein
MPKDAFPNLRFGNDFANTGHVALNPLYERRMNVRMMTRGANSAANKLRTPNNLNRQVAKDGKEGRNQQRIS